MNTASSVNAEFLHQERVDNAVKTAMPLDSDDMEFLKSHADGGERARLAKAACRRVQGGEARKKRKVGLTTHHFMNLILKPGSFK